MKLLIKQAVIADITSPFNGQKQDIFIANGVITAIGPDITEAAERVIRIDGLHISPGWVDIFCQFHDPGGEDNETLESGARAAAAGGFTDVFVVPNTFPVLHNKSQLEYIIKKSYLCSATVHPIGAITKNCAGKELSEMYDMKSNGAVAFSDGWCPLQSSQIMLKALQYVKLFNGIIIQIPDEISLTKHGLMNEGPTSVKLGLPGVPSMAEALMIFRDIKLLKYTESRLHITGVSTGAGIELIRKAKKEGLNITCSVTPYHLYFIDEDLDNYDTNLKVNPVIRSKEDVEILKNAVMDGTVDCITSHHFPQNWDNKTCEFEYAKNGMEGLESVMGAVLTALPQLPIERFVSLFSANARKIFGLEKNAINLNREASLSLYVPNESSMFTKEHIKSSCTNNAFIGKRLQGKVIGTIRGKRLFLND